MSIFKTAVFSILFFCGASHTASGEDASRLFSSLKDKIVQVRVLDRSSGLKATIGSGFIVTPTGDIATNYHVVSKIVQKPERYTVEYLRENGEKGELRLVGIDVVHDLAILTSQRLSGDYLRLETRQLSKGESLYSIGNPFDLGLTIVQGTYNGLLEKSLYNKIHFTGSINPGMSGGPTINAKGRVVGVNVSTSGNQVSFLVPSIYIERLLSDVSKGVSEDFNVMVRDQLIENQENYVSLLLKEPIKTMQIGRYSLPGEMAPFIKCWGDTSKREELHYEQMYQHCSTNDDLFISDHFSSGSIQYRHDLYTTDRMGPVRFYRLLEEEMQQSEFYSDGDEEDVGNYACKSSLVEHNGLAYKMVLCLRGYKNLAGLYDSYLSAVTLVSDNEAIRTTLSLTGVSHENAVRFNRAFIEAIKWKN